MHNIYIIGHKLMIQTKYLKYKFNIQLPQHLPTIGLSLTGVAFAWKNQDYSYRHVLCLPHAS